MPARVEAQRKPWGNEPERWGNEPERWGNEPERHVQYEIQFFKKN